MLRQLLPQNRFVRHLACGASFAILLLGLANCQTAGPSDITGSLGDKAETTRGADARSEVDADRDRYRADPKSVEAALQYGKALRATGQRTQAVAVL